MATVTILSILTSMLLLIFANPAAATSGPSELVQTVCNHTTNRNFCLEALTSDPRSRTADAYGLAFVAFGMAYFNASATQDMVAELVKKASGNVTQAKRLERCGRDYGKAADALEMAYNDLNSETFFELAELAGEASDHVGDCQAAFKGAADRPLTSSNSALKGLCEVCVAVSKLFTGGF